jgi:hypothetical protein
MHNERSKYVLVGQFHFMYVSSHNYYSYWTFVRIIAQGKIEYLWMYEHDRLFAIVQACLAAIIIVALKGLILQTKDIYTIGCVTKLEAVKTDDN